MTYSRQENEFILLEDGEVDYVLEHIVNHVYVQFQVTLCQFFMQLQKATKQLESGELVLVLQNWTDELRKFLFSDIF